MKVLEAPIRTPTPEPHSSDFEQFFKTPTAHHFAVHEQYLKRKFNYALEEDYPLSPTLPTKICKLIKGLKGELLSGQLAIEELHRNKQAEMRKTERKAGSNRMAQNGGVVTVGNARLQIEKRKESDVALAQKALHKAQVAEMKPYKLVFKDAARAAKVRIRRLTAAKKAEVAAAKLSARRQR
jgi:hypothetical protein